MVAQHNQISAGSDISKRNPNPDRETASRIRAQKGRRARIERAKERSHDGPVTPAGLRQNVKAGLMSPREALDAVLANGGQSTAFVGWCSRKIASDWKPVAKTEVKSSQRRERRGKASAKKVRNRKRNSR